MDASTTNLTGNFHELTLEEARELFEQRVRKYLGIGADEFLARWDAGEYGNPDDPYRPNVMRVMMLLPLIGRTE